MSEDSEKPLTGDDAEAQPTRPRTDTPGQPARTSSAPSSTEPETLEEDVGGVQGTPDDDRSGEDAGRDAKQSAIGRPAIRSAGGGEIEWTMLGDDPARDTTQGGAA